MTKWSAPCRSGTYVKVPWRGLQEAGDDLGYSLALSLAFHAILDKENGLQPNSSSPVDSATTSLVGASETVAFCLPILFRQTQMNEYLEKRS